MGETYVECSSCEGDVTANMRKPERPIWCNRCGSHIMLYHCSKCDTNVAKCDQCG